VNGRCIEHGRRIRQLATLLLIITGRGPHPLAACRVVVERFREKRKSPTSSKTGSQRWGEERERHILLSGPPKEQKKVPTLEQFASRFIDEHAKANRQKPSGIAAKEMILRVHLVPVLGHRKLDAIKNDDVQRLKHNLQAKSPKTVNNILTVLNVLLRKAVEWEVIERMPCSIKPLPVPKGSPAFFDFDEFGRLAEAARMLDPQTHLIILLGGEAGLRCGEMIALEWADIDLANRQVCIRRSDWNGQVTTPKSGRLRRVPLTRRLAAALAAHRHLRSSRVLCEDKAQPLTRQMVQSRVKSAARKAGVSEDGVHALRHTLCSHLAMKGASTRAIQEAAGHQELGTTQRYMHLSPAALDDAIRLLELPQPRFSRGDILETDRGADGNVND
jgi:integrase